jgi:hypothetical protein
MKRDQFIRELRGECKARGWTLVVDVKMGKGSHYEIRTSNGRRATLKSGELSPI